MGWGLSDRWTGSAALRIELVSDLWFPLQFHGQVPVWGLSWLPWRAIFGLSVILPLIPCRYSPGPIPRGDRLLKAVLGLQF